MFIWHTFGIMKMSEIMARRSSMYRAPTTSDHIQSTITSSSHIFFFTLHFYSTARIIFSRQFRFVSSYVKSFLNLKNCLKIQYESISFTNYFNIVEITFYHNYRISIILGLLNFYYYQYHEILLNSFSN